MRVLLQRNLFAGGNRYRVHLNGTEIPDDVDLPPGAKVWDGKEFVIAPEGKKEREALVKKSSKAVEEEEEKAAKEDPPNVPLRVYDPRYKSPNSPAAIQGSMPMTGEERKAEEAREKKERRMELGRIAEENSPLPPPKEEVEAVKPAKK